MAGKKIKTNFLGVRYREHPTRRISKDAVGKDRCFFIRYKIDGTDREEVVGWASEDIDAEKAFEYLFGKKASRYYRFVYVAVVMYGCVAANAFVWDISDTFNALMAIPNLFSLLLLSPVLVSETKKYLWDDNLDALDETPIPQINRK